MFVVKNNVDDSVVGIFDTKRFANFFVDVLYRENQNSWESYSVFPTDRWFSPKISDYVIGQMRSKR